MKNLLPLKRILLLFMCVLIAQLSKSQNCTANAGLDQTLCVTQPLTLTGTPGNPMAATPAYLWTQVSGPAVTIVSPTATTTSVTGITPGNYVFQFSNKCIDNLFATNLVSITVLPEPPLAQAGNDTAICSAATIPLSANAVPAPFTGTWTVSPTGGTFSNANSPTSTYTPPAGNTTYTLTWTVGNGACTTSDAKVLKVVIPATVSAGSNKTLSCSGSCYTLAGSNPGIAPPQTGIWTVVSGPSAPVFSNVNSNTSSVCNLIPGVYVLKWSVSGPCRTGSANVTLTVSNISVAPSAGSAATYTTYCSATPVTAQVLTGAALAAGETAVWRQTGGGIAPYPNVTFVPDTVNSNVTITGMNGPSPYTFSYIKSNASGCSATATHTVYRAPSIANLTDPPNKDLACDVQATTFTMAYDNSVNVTSGLTRAATRITGPAAVGTASNTTSDTLSIPGKRIDTWSVTGLTTAGTYIFRIEYRNSCGSVYKDIAITTSKTPSAINAGSSPILPCNTLFANPIGAASTPYSLTWLQLSGPNTATLSGANTTSLNMTGLDAGLYKMRLVNSGGAACPSVTSDVLVKVVRAVPTVATTGANATICAGRYRLTANTPGDTETGTWSVTPSSGITFSNINAPNAFVSGLAPNTVYTFTWAISNTCGSIASSQVLTTTNLQAPPIPLAGADICRPTGSTTATLSGNAPAGATVLWTALTPNSSVSAASSPSTAVSLTGGSGVYLFAYSLSTPGCTTFADTVEVTVNNTIAQPNAGADIDICTAAVPASVTLTATPAAPAGSTAIWSQISGPAIATLAAPGDASTAVAGLQQGIYEFEYRIKTGSCTELFDTVVVRVAQEPSAAIAGADITRCAVTNATNITLAATAPTVGTGYWQVISGPPGSGTATFSNATLANSTIKGLTQGVYTLRWTTFNGPACGAKTSDMTITVTSAADAGSDVALCDKTSAGLTGVANTAGTWSLVSGSAGTTITPNAGNTAIVTGLTSAAGGNAYTFRYTLPAIGSCASSFDDVVVTNYIAPVAADAGPDKEICQDINTVALTGVLPANYTAAWSLVTGPTPVATAGTANAAYQDTVLNGLVPGIYTYQYAINTNSACVASADRMQIIKEAAATVPAAQHFCNVSTVSLGGNAPLLHQGTWSYVSGPAGYTITNINNPATTVTGLVAGTYVFRWAIAGAGGCAVNSADQQITIDPAVPEIIAGSNAVFCEGSALPFQLGAAPINGVTYTWSPATLLSDASVPQPTFTGVNNAGNFTYTVRGNIGACETFKTVTVTVNPKPNANINIAPGICSASFSTSDVGAGVKEPITYSWSFSNGNLSTGSGAGPFDVAYPSGGAKNITLNVVSGDGCTGSKTIAYTPACVLPVTITSFTANWKSSAALLQWNIAAAQNFDHFEVERSYDGRAFNKIATVAFSSTATKYSYEDKNISTAAATIYYRLKLLDNNNGYSYSEMKTLASKQISNVVVSPNPFQGRIEITFKEAATSKIVLKLLNGTGQAVVVKTIYVSAGQHVIEMANLGSIAKGVYTLQFFAGNRVESFKVLKL